MAQQAWKAADFQGLTPGVDPRRSDKFFALTGRNYVFDSIGPRSAFGDTLLKPLPHTSQEQAQGFTLHQTGGTRSFLLLPDCILEWVESAGDYVIHATFDSIALTNYRWTYGYLNDYLFICHPAAGMFAMDINVNQMFPYDAPGAPEDPVAITVDNGRLHIMSSTWNYWSGQSDGFDFDPALGGAGSVKINDRVSGYPVLVTSYGQGVLVWTTQGLLRGAFTGDQSVYQWRGINTEYRPINSLCILQVTDSTTVILDQRGLFQSSGEAPTPYAPLFNEFLIGYIERQGLTVGYRIRIEWDADRRRLYLSVNLDASTTLYAFAFCYYQPVDKWGRLDWAHWGLMPVTVGPRTFFSRIGQDGGHRVMQDIASVQGSFVQPTLVYFTPVINKPPRISQDLGATVFSSSAVFSSTGAESHTRSGFYQVGASEPALPTRAGLNSLIQLGLLRFDINSSHDRMTEVLSVFIGSHTSESGNNLIVDYNLIPSGIDDQDYNQTVGAEDFGVEPANYVNHGMRIISTNDGKGEIDSTVPELVEFARGGRHYSCSTQGIWHVLELTALTAGESYALKAFELTATDAGTP